MKQQRYIFLRILSVFRSVAERMESFHTVFLLFLTLVSLGQGVSDQRYCLHKTRLTIFLNLHKYTVPLAGMLESQLVEVEERNYFFNLQYFIIVVENVLRDPCYEARLYYQLEKRFLELSEVTNVKTQFEKVFENLKFNT